MGDRNDVVRVGVGSTRGPKVEAVRRTLHQLRQSFSDFLPGELTLEARKVPSGTAETPRSTKELMMGAKNRALAVAEELSREGLDPTLAIGLEGGIVAEAVEGDGCSFWLESWAYATDGRRGYFGSSGCLPLPEAVVVAVVEHEEELGPAADRIFAERDVAAHRGTFGVLTEEQVTREEAFRRSLLHALAPFYNGRRYRPLAEQESNGAE